jgi:hypothetical protein
LAILLVFVRHLSILYFFLESLSSLSFNVFHLLVQGLSNRHDLIASYVDQGPPAVRPLGAACGDVEIILPLCGLSNSSLVLNRSRTVYGLFV